ncbi:hypothetical protein Tco_1556534 [Tanacetum coccineum]
MLTGKWTLMNAAVMKFNQEETLAHSGENDENHMARAQVEKPRIDFATKKSSLSFNQVQNKCWKECFTLPGGVSGHIETISSSLIQIFEKMEADPEESSEEDPFEEDPSEEDEQLLARVALAPPTQPPPVTMWARYVLPPSIEAAIAEYTATPSHTPDDAMVGTARLRRRSTAHRWGWIYEIQDHIEELPLERFETMQHEIDGAYTSVKASQEEIETLHAEFGQHMRGFQTWSFAWRILRPA